MTKPLLATLCLLFSTLCCHAQDSLLARAIMMGAGAANTYDTYLSPQEHKGWQLSLMMENTRMTRWHNIATQGKLCIAFTDTHNRAANGTCLGALLGYRQSWLYRWTLTPHWQLSAGGGAGANVGGLYYAHNAGNNPANAHLDASLHAAASATYAWRWLRVCLTAEAPLVGVMFAPAYGQSYYEIFTKQQSRNNVVFAHPFNAPTLRTLLTFDFHIPTLMPHKRARHSHLGTLRIAYGADILQSTPNNLRRHTYLHTAYIGFVRHFKAVR